MHMSGLWFTHVCFSPASFKPNKEILFSVLDTLGYHVTCMVALCDAARFY